MAAMVAILKICFFVSSPKPKSQLTPNLVGSTGVTYRSKITKIVLSEIQDGRHGHLENQFFASSSELKSQLTGKLACDMLYHKYGEPSLCVDTLCCESFISLTCYNSFLFKRHGWSECYGALPSYNCHFRLVGCESSCAV